MTRARAVLTPYPLRDVPEAFTGARFDGLRALVEALGPLGASDSKGTQVVEHQHFTGLAQAEAAEVPGG